MHPFEKYLRQHNLEPLTVSVKAKVRYLTVWNAMKSNPITADQAQKIRQAAIFKMLKFINVRAGTAYTPEDVYIVKMY